MARDTVTVNENARRYPALQPAANSLDFAFTAGESDNGYQYPATGREVVIMRNTNGAPQTFTLQSVRNVFGREGDIETYSLGAGEFAVLIPPLKGFQQADGNIYIDISHDDVHVAVLRMPSMS